MEEVVRIRELDGIGSSGDRGGKTLPVMTVIARIFTGPDRFITEDPFNHRHHRGGFRILIFRFLHTHNLSDHLYCYAMKVAIQGERGSFSHQAATEMVPGAQVFPCSRSIEVFDALESRRAGCAVIPVENTLAGYVGEHLDLLLEREVFIQREYRLRIEHNLMVAPGVKLKDLRRVFSHPVALDQCRKFFQKHTGIAAIAFYDTAGSVKHILGNKLRDSGAIAGHHAAREYGAEIIMSGLEDEKQNFTRFFLIQKRKKVLANADKSSIVFSLNNVSGALFKALSVFALRDLDLSKIESRPVRGRPWEYMFYVDILRGEDEAMRKALDHLAEIAGFVKVLGVYPRSK